MALIDCPECGKSDVSDHAEKCPNCGYPVKEFIAKRNQKNKAMNKQAVDPVHFCKICGYVYDFGEMRICPCCNAKMLSTGRDYEYFVDLACSDDIEEGMDCDELVRIEFVYGNPEYNLEKGKLREQLNKEEAALRFGGTISSAKCPTCGSANVSPIGGLERGVSVAMLGLFSRKINKSFKCRNCGTTW